MYEIYIALNPLMNKEQLTDTLGKITLLLRKIEKLHDWGQRTLINPPTNKVHAFVIQGDIEDITVFEEKMKQIDGIIRYLVCEVPSNINESVEGI